MQGNKREIALEHFVQAHRLSPRNKEIVFYKSSAMIMMFRNIMERAELTKEQIKDCFSNIFCEYDVAIKLQKADHFLHFYRGLLNLYTHGFENALADLDKAIKNNDETSAKYRRFRGLAYACMSMFKEAMKDLSAAIEIKEDYLSAYYNRGKCAYLLGNVDLAFSDFQKLLVLQPVTLHFLADKY